VTARLATADDTAVVIRLVSALQVELGGQALTAEAQAVYRTLISGEPGTGFVMLGGLTEAEPQAVCTVSYVHAMRTMGRYGVIQEMYVEPALRSTGVGRELLEAALSESVQRGCAMVELGTPFQGDRQIQFYERTGFTNIGARLRWRPS